MKDRSFRRRLRAVALLGAVLAFLLFLIEFAVPWVAVKTGVATGYQIGTFRFGRAEFAHWWERTSSRARNEPHRVGIVFSPGAAELEIAWESRIETGDPRLVVRTWPDREVRWRTELTPDELSGDTIVPLEGSSLYWISLSAARWTGRAVVTWRVLSSRDGAEVDGPGTLDSLPGRATREVYAGKR